MKTRMKRLISLLCVVTVFTSTVMSTNFLSAKAETNSGQKETLPTDMTEISFRDFELKKTGTSGGFADGPHTAWNYGEYGGGTMDNTLFGGTITFPKKVDASFVYACDAEQKGLGLMVAGDDSTGWYLRLRHSNIALLKEKKITATDAGVDELVGVPLELHISMKYVDHDNQGQDNDLELGLWFGDKLYMDDYIYINNYVGADNTGNYLYLRPYNDTMIIKSTDMSELTFEDFEIEDGTYDDTFSGNYAGKTMDKTLFSAKIKFSETGKTDFMFGGTKASGGFSLQPNWDETNNKYYLRLYDTNADESGIKINERLDTDKAGVTTFVGEEFKLNYTLEYVNHDDETTKNDLKLGVWFNGKLYNNRYFYIDDYVDNGHSIGGYITVWVREGATIDLKSCNYQLPDDLTDISFRDFPLKTQGLTSFTDDTYTKWNYGVYGEDSLENTLFSGTVTFPEQTGAFLTYAGSDAQNGLTLTVNKDTQKGVWYLTLSHTEKDLLGKALNQKAIYPADAGVAKLVGAELELHISMEYVNLDGGEANDDLKLGLWFGDTLYQDQYIYIKNYVGANATARGNVLSFHPKGESITFKSADIKLPKGMTEISFRDFGFIDDDYKGYEECGEYEGETLDNTLFSGKVNFPEAKEVYLQYGGKVQYGGFNLGTAWDENKQEWYLQLYDTNVDKGDRAFDDNYKFYSEEADVDKLVGAELELNITMQYVTNDAVGTNDDVKLGVWFGGKLYQNKYIYLNNFVDTSYSMGTLLTLYVGNNNKLGIESMGKINWKPLPTGMTEITFRDFGFIDDDYSAYPCGEYEGETLDNTLFSGKVNFPEAKEVYLQYGGKVQYGGFNLGTAWDEDKQEWYLQLYDTNLDKGDKAFTKYYKFYSDVADVDKLVGAELELNISMEYMDHDGGGKEDDVKLGVWFGGKLYNNNYIYLDNFVDTSYSMGTLLTLYVGNNNKLAIESMGKINWKPLPTGLTEITFRDFGFTDGDYTKYPNGQYEGKTLDNTLFKGKITFPKYANAFLQYGGKVAGGGFNIGTAQDATTGEWYLRLFDTNQDKSGRKFSEYKFTTAVAGVPLVGEELDLMISLQYVDADGKGGKNDVKLGVWFAGKLYNNRYIYLNGFAKTGHSMGTWMAFSVPKTTKITIKSVGEINWKPLPMGLTEIGFGDFGITSGVYEAGSKVGEYTGENLKNTLFSGIVKWHPEVGETHFIYGGTTSGGGFDLVNVTDEKTGEHYLRLFYTTPTKDGKKTYTNYYFHSDVAGVTLVGEELDLKISIEYVDNDGGKKDNDVRLGIWFGGKLYNNRYIYINNFGATGHILKNNIQIWNRNGASFSVGRISDWLDWSAFGLNANWKKTLLDTDFNLEYTLAGGNPYTGDDITFPYLAVSVCLIAAALCGCQIIRKGRKEDGQC